MEYSGQVARRQVGKGRGAGCDGEGEWGNEERGVGRLIEIDVVLCCVVLFVHQGKPCEISAYVKIKAGFSYGVGFLFVVVMGLPMG